MDKMVLQPDSIRLLKYCILRNSSIDDIYIEYIQFRTLMVKLWQEVEDWIYKKSSLSTWYNGCQFNASSWHLYATTLFDYLHKIENQCYLAIGEGLWTIM